MPITCMEDILTYPKIDFKVPTHAIKYYYGTKKDGRKVVTAVLDGDEFKRYYNSREKMASFIRKVCKGRTILHDWREDMAYPIAENIIDMLYETLMDWNFDAKAICVLEDTYDQKMGEAIARKKLITQIRGHFIRGMRRLRTVYATMVQVFFATYKYQEELLKLDNPDPIE